jgi:hypothetical protein
MTDSSVSFIISKDDTLEPLFTFIKTILYKNSIPNKYQIGSNNNISITLDSIYEYEIGDSVYLKLSKLDSSKFEFVEWASNTTLHNVKTDSMVHFFIADDDTIEVVYKEIKDSVVNSISALAKEKIAVYPTVFKDIIQIHTALDMMNVSIALYNVEGRKALDIRANDLFKGANRLRLNNIGLSEGYYYLLIKTDTHNFVYKLKHLP